ncbi:MAG: peptidase MA family metallohydrolase [Planctomycetaceae bacterium]
MHRSLSAAALVASLLIGLHPPRAVAAPPETLSRARALLGRGEARPAVPLLEGALPTVSPDDRPALLDLLRRAYDLAARQAEDAGQSDEAGAYRDNLEILNRRPRTEPASAPAPGPVAGSRPEAPAPTDPAVARAPAVAQTFSPPAPVPSSVPEPVRAAAVPGGQPPATPAPRGLAAEVAAADAAFVARRYDEAGRIYAALDREHRLPASRRDHWAYCRWVDIVRRINAGPSSPQEWAGIDAEIEKIRALSPNNWFGEYLRHRAAERTAGRRGGKGGKVVVRGSSPDEPPPGLAPSNRPRPPARPPDPNPPGAIRAAAPREPEAVHEVNRTPGAPGNWQVRETPSFRIMHADAALAEQVARVAEATHEAQTRRWAGSDPRGPWSPKCDIYLYPTARIFGQMTGQPEPSPGFSTMGMSAGRIIARRINLRADHPNLLAAVLPHEITHVVLADLFPVQQVPRWADEGMAVLSEPNSEQRLRAADLEEPLSSGTLFKLEDLMAMDYPDGRYWGLYYAQSVSLTRFLVEQGTPAQFVQFVQGAQRRGPEAELRRVYQIDGLADLQDRWLTYARGQARATATAAAPSDDPAQGPASSRR